MMTKRLQRFLLGFTALLLTVGGLMHATAFKKTLSVLGDGNLPPFYTESFKVLWLSDSTTLIAVGIIFAFIAARPSVATRSVIVLLALVPAAISVLLYIFMGNFFPAHILAVASVCAVCGGLI
jgi:hypothetical protein